MRITITIDPRKHWPSEDHIWPEEKSREKVQKQKVSLLSSVVEPVEKLSERKSVQAATQDTVTPTPLTSKSSASPAATPTRQKIPFDRDEYHRDYMRKYMRKKRAQAKEKKEQEGK